MNAWFGNRLLDALGGETARRAAPHLSRAYLQRGQVLANPERPLHGFIFPIDALVWDWSPGIDRDTIASQFESGRSGASGGRAWLSRTGHNESVSVLLSGTAWRLAPAAVEVTGDDPTFLRMIGRWMADRFAIAARRLICTAEHNLDRRLARTLLWIMDETGRPEIALTHREISALTAIRRPSVSLALADFQKSGIMRLQHGLVQVLDRARLERECCSCYHAIRAIAAAPAQGQDVSREGQTSSSRISQPAGWESANTTALATFEGSLS